MGHVPHSPDADTERRWWLAWWGSGIAGFLLAFGVYSFLYVRWTPASKLWEIVGALYSAAALLVLDAPPELVVESDVHPLASGLLFLAKLSAVAFAGLTAVMVIKALSGNQIRRLWISRGHHTVVCGGDFLGTHLVTELKGSDAGEPSHRGVILLDAAAGGVALAGAGRAFLQGDATDSGVLRKAGIASAARIIAATHDDMANIAHALRVAEFIDTQRPSGRPEIFIHLADSQVRAALRRQRAFMADGAARVTVFNVFENSARLLLLEHGLDYVRIRGTDDCVVHLVIVGFGSMGEAVLVRAALTGHYANGARLRALVIDRDAQRREALFYSRYPQFGHVCDVQFMSADADTAATRHAIAQSCASPRLLSTIVMCLGDDTQALGVALSLVPRLPPEVPIRVRLRDEAAVALLVRHSDINADRPRVTPFGSFRRACSREHFTRNNLDTLARQVHETYQSRPEERETSAGGSLSRRDWDRLDEDLRDSNRQLADHIPVKVRALGYRLVSVNDPNVGVRVDQFSLDERTLLGKMEHQRWMAERFVGGWVYGKEKDVEGRISPYLVPWDEVPPAIQEYDFRFADVLPALVKSAGKEIRRL